MAGMMFPAMRRDTCKDAWGPRGWGWAVVCTKPGGGATPLVNDEPEVTWALEKGYVGDGGWQGDVREGMAGVT